MQSHRLAPLASLVLATLALGPALAAQNVRFLTPMYARAVQSDIVYGGNLNPWTNQFDTLKLDIHEPLGDSSPARPVYLHVHGGQFYYGSKTNAEVIWLADFFVSRGFVMVACNYRLAPTYNHGNLGPDVCAEDAKAAVRWLRKNAAQHRIDPNRIMIGGDSTGATGAYTATYTTWPGLSGNPGYDHTANSMFGMWGMCFPTVSNTSVPLYFTHGTGDTALPYSEALRIKAQADQYGVFNRLVLVNGGTHSMWDRWTEFLPPMWLFVFQSLRLGELAGLNVPLDYKTGPTATFFSTGWEDNIAFLFLSPNTGNYPIPPFGTLLLDPFALIPIGGVQHAPSSMTTTVTHQLSVPPGIIGRIYAQTVWFSSASWWVIAFSNRVALNWP